MTDSSIALIILAIIFVMYVSEIFSVATTTMIGMLAFVFTGILTYDEAFSCFGSMPVMLTLAAGSLLGGTGSLAGGTAPLLANEVLIYSGAKHFSFFSTLPVALCVIGAVSLCFWLFIRMMLLL